MTTTRLFTAFICLLLAGDFWGCTDHRFPVVTPGVNRLRVKTIAQQVTNGASTNTVSAFSYDSQGRLSSILAYQMPDSVAAPVENTVYQYDAQNRLIQIQHAVIRRGSASERYEISYNSAGQVAQLTNLSSTFSITPRYNAANQIQDYGRQISVGGLNSTGGGSFTLTGNNITVASEAFSVFRSGQGGGPPVYGRSTNTAYTFDDKVNPFYGVFIIPAPGVFASFAGSTSGLGPVYTLYGGTDNLFNLSQNNVLSALTNGGATTYSYTYNTSNLPTSRTTTISTGVSEVLRYEYEPY